MVPHVLKSLKDGDWYAVEDTNIVIELTNSDIRLERANDYWIVQVDNVTISVVTYNYAINRAIAKGMLKQSLRNHREEVDAVEELKEYLVD